MPHECRAGDALEVTHAPPPSLATSRMVNMVLLQKNPMMFPGVLNVAPFHVRGEDREEEVHFQMLRELEETGHQTELSYLLSNVSKQPRQPYLEEGPLHVSIFVTLARGQYFCFGSITPSDM